MSQMSRLAQERAENEFDHVAIINVKTVKPVQPPIITSPEPPRDLWEKFFSLFDETKNLLRAVGIYCKVTGETGIIDTDLEHALEAFAKYYSSSLKTLEDYIEKCDGRANKIAKEISEVYATAGLYLTPAWLRMCLEKNRDGVRREIRLARAKHRFPRFENPAH